MILTPRSSALALPAAAPDDDAEESGAAVSAAIRLVLVTSPLTAWATVARPTEVDSVLAPAASVAVTKRVTVSVSVVHRQPRPQGPQGEPAAPPWPQPPGPPALLCF